MLVYVSVVRRIPSEEKTLIHPEWEWIESSKPGPCRGADSGVVLSDPAVSAVPSRTGRSILDFQKKHLLTFVEVHPANTEQGKRRLNEDRQHRFEDFTSLVLLRLVR